MARRGAETKPTHGDAANQPVAHYPFERGSPRQPFFAAFSSPPSFSVPFLRGVSLLVYLSWNPEPIRQASPPPSHFSIWFMSSMFFSLRRPLQLYRPRALAWFRALMLGMHVSKRSLPGPASFLAPAPLTGSTPSIPCLFQVLYLTSATTKYRYYWHYWYYYTSTTTTTTSTIPC
jgi:hypothetical protein